MQNFCYKGHPCKQYQLHVAETIKYLLHNPTTRRCKLSTHSDQSSCVLHLAVSTYLILLLIYISKSTVGSTQDAYKILQNKVMSNHCIHYNYKFLYAMYYKKTQHVTRSEYCVISTRISSLNNTFWVACQ